MVLFHRLTIVFVLAFAARAMPIMYQEWREPGWHAANVNEIEFYYDDVARSLIVGEGFVHSANPRPETSWKFEPGTPFHFVPPLYAWWVGLIYFLFGPNILLAKLLQAVMDASVCLLLYVLAKRVTHCRHTALLAALLYAVYPLAIRMCETLYYQIPMNLALVWIVLCLTATRTWQNALWTGLAVAVSALAKPVTLPLIGIIPMVAIAESIWNRSSLKSSLLWCVLFVVASLAALTPWTIRNYLVFERFVPIQSGAGSPLLLGSKEAFLDLDTDAVRERFGTDLGVPSGQSGQVAIQNHLQHLTSNPLDYARFLAKKFVMTWYNTEGKAKNRLALIVQVPFLVLAVLGLLVAPRLWLKRGNWYVPASVLYITGIQVAFYPLVRYTLAVMPLVMILAAVGAMWVLRISSGLVKAKASHASE